VAATDCPCIGPGGVITSSEAWPRFCMSTLDSSTNRFAPVDVISRARQVGRHLLIVDRAVQQIDCECQPISGYMGISRQESAILNATAYSRVMRVGVRMGSPAKTRYTDP
jgi:hypothetical protein